MMRRYLLVLLATFLLAGCAGVRPGASPTGASVPPASTLRLASWNLEFLAAADGSGCNPRTAADYAAMRAVVDSLNADVIAFEEAESVEAASRVFDPAHYTVVMEARPGRPGGACSAQQPNQIFIRQAVGFAIRRGLSFVRAPDLTELEVGNANLRSGVDITVTPKGGMPLRLLAVHLKSGCFEGTTGTACPQLLKQIPVVAKWIDEAAAGPTRFAVLGDWNRRLGLPGDAFWATIDDASPPNADLRLADERVAPRCDPKFTAFIDHIVLDKRAGAQFLGFKETTFPQGRRPSDHCPIVADLRR